jgi:hypothetical protein
METKHNIQYFIQQLNVFHMCVKKGKPIKETQHLHTPHTTTQPTPHEGITDERNASRARRMMGTYMRNFVRADLVAQLHVY